MSSQGPLSGGTFASDASQGSEPWANPSNASASDDVRATMSLDAPNDSELLKCTNFGFSIPGTATIDGVVVSVERRKGFVGECHDQTIRLYKAGSLVGSNKATATAWPTSDASVSYGSSTDLWGTTWTPSEINNSGFGIGVAAIADSGTTAPAIDHVTITVHYTEEGGGGGGGNPDPIFFGRTANPTDNGSLSATSVTLTPPASMQVLDLVLVCAVVRDESGSVAWSVSQAGGQTWTAIGGTLTGYGCSLQRWACTFNGSWSADPIFATGIAAQTIIGLMTVFRPSSACIGWKMDLETYSFLLDESSPYDLTFNSVQVRENKEVILVEWHRDVLHTMSLQTAGWSNPGGDTQWRNTAGSDLLLSAGYKIQDAGFSGSVTNRAATGPTYQGATYMSFAELAKKTEQQQKIHKRHRQSRW